MKLNQNTRLIGNLTILVPYKKHHVEKYHRWMQDTELQELTASEPLTLEQEYDMQKSWLEDDDKCTFLILDKETWEVQNDEVYSMIGDVNLFFNNQDDPKEAEIEVMIAEKTKQGQGRGKEALLAMFLYGVDVLGVKKFVAKIKCSNHQSLGLFGKVGFTKVSESHVFQEISLICVVTDNWLKQLRNWTNHIRIDDHYEMESISYH